MVDRIANNIIGIPPKVGRYAIPGYPGWVLSIRPCDHGINKTTVWLEKPAQNLADDLCRALDFTHVDGEQIPERLMGNLDAWCDLHGLY